jgi:spoIIIJ-associated protein
MSSEHAIETTGDNIEEAIARGLAELGVSPTEVIVEILDEPSKGVFGIGARPARVRLQLLGGKKAAAPPPVEKPSAPPPSQAPSRVAPPPAQERRPSAPPAQVAEEIEIEEDTEEEDSVLLFSVAEVIEEQDQDEEAVVGRVVLGELLERMDIRAQVIVRRAPPSREGEAVPYILDVTGSNLSRLIGRRGETLAALQYITRLVTSREIQRRANIIVDVDGYKARRAQMLYNLAMRMADQAVNDQRTVTLEPMPPYERRIIHLALRTRDDVSTRSIGEGTSRRVTIVPKE